MVRLRKLLARTGLVTAVVLAALVVAEVAVRCTWSGPPGLYPAGLFVADASAGFRLARGFRGRFATAAFDTEIATNARGFRDREVGAKPAGVRRILALGDSFAFGQGVEVNAAYPDVLEQLELAAGHRTEVINAGVPGYGTAAAFALLRDEAPLLEPDLVLLGLYVGNDFRDNLHEKFGRLEARGGMLVPVFPGEPWLRRAWMGLLSQWRTAQLAMIKWGGVRGPPTPAEEQREVRASLSWHPGFGLAMVTEPWDADANKAFDATVSWLGHIRDFCRQRQCGLLIVLLPGPEQYDDAYWRMLVQRFALDDRDYDRGKPNRELTVWCAANGIEVLDLLPAFRQHTAAAGKLQWLYSDQHFNVAGHRLAAELIAAAIQR